MAAFGTSSNSDLQCKVTPEVGSDQENPLKNMCLARRDLSTNNDLLRELAGQRQNQEIIATPTTKPPTQPIQVVSGTDVGLGTKDNPVRMNAASNVPMADLEKLLIKGATYSITTQNGSEVTGTINGASGGPAESINRIRQDKMNLGTPGSARNPIDLKEIVSNPAYAAYVEKNAGAGPFTGQMQNGELVTLNSQSFANAKAEIYQKLNIPAVPIPDRISVSQIPSGSSLLGGGNQKLAQLAANQLTGVDYDSNPGARPNPGQCYRLAGMGIERTAGTLTDAQDSTLASVAPNRPNEVLNYVFNQPEQANRTFSGYNVVTAQGGQEVNKLRTMLDSAPPGSVLYSTAPDRAGHYVVKLENGRWATGHNPSGGAALEIKGAEIPYSNPTAAVLMVPKSNQQLVAVIGDPLNANLANSRPKPSSVPNP